MLIQPLPVDRSDQNLLQGQKSFCNFIAAPMSPLILSFPVMYAVVAFCSPLTIFWKFSSEVEIVQSASPPPSVTSIEPSSTCTRHWPAPSMSKRYELCMPAVFDASTDLSFSKNSLVAAILVSLLCVTRGVERSGEP